MVWHLALGSGLLRAGRTRLARRSAVGAFMMLIWPFQLAVSLAG